MEPNKSDIKRNEDGTIAYGSGPLNPSGRPKGKTLKEFARDLLMTMDDEQKTAFLKDLPKEIVWKMSEGNPHQTQETELKGAVKVEFAGTFNKNKEENGNQVE